MSNFNTQVLLTGSAGFIGSHLARLLVEEGFTVRAMVRYSSRPQLGNLEFLPPHVLKEIEILKGDLKDPDFGYRAAQNCTYIFHLGALIAIPYSYQNPTDFVQTNVTGTTYLLNAARKSDTLQRFIHTSTSEVYGTARYTPIDEQHPLQPQSPYSASKMGADLMALSYYNAFNLPVTVVRPFNTFGPYQSARAVIPTIISQLQTLSTIKLGNLSPKRDFLYVKDTAAGFLQVGTHANTPGKVVNLGTGRDVSIAETYELICRLMGKNPELLTDATRFRPEKSEVFHLICNAGLAHELTGWKPKYTLEQGLQETISWIQNHIELYKPQEYNV
ncbi:NAD-dependent dehydratase [Sphingobacteriales bacterium UPWRP_1]|nr:NAD-dependent dehydratase [Sphingobacteriales bacterium TSM_CSS]PSJ75468.1 NAD-dependent dehydratase [Sphingobacteriales bacterium UPWRP_1]